jgi:uncharacterized membrane protein YfhO
VRNLGELPAFYQQAEVQRDRMATQPSASPRCDVQQLSGGRVVVDLETDRDGWLVLNEMFAPGWQAELQSEEQTVSTEVIAAYGLQRAVRVPAGKHRLTLVYRPASVRWGGAVSAASALAICLFAWVARRKRRCLGDQMR